jgi:predicted HicB family RNase H-like nuclease
VKVLTYKGYQASVEHDDGKLFVKVLHIDDLLIGECDYASEAQQIFVELIDDYLSDCSEMSREPAKPFKGSFNIRMSPDLHRRAAMRAAKEGVSLNNRVQSAVEQKIQRENVP